MFLKEEEEKYGFIVGKSFLTYKKTKFKKLSIAFYYLKLFNSSFTEL